MKPNFTRILCPVDFDANSLAALDFAADLAQHNSARLIALHVVRTEFTVRRKADLDSMMIQEAGARQWLQEIARARLAGVPHDLVTRTGLPDVAILHTAEELGADLIAMATHSRTVVPHTFRGSIAEAVVRQSRWPVLLVPARLGGNVDMVEAWMTPNPQTAAPQTTLGRISETMRRGGFHAMPVVDGNRLLGIITDHDVRSHAGELEDVQALTAMTSDVVTVTCDTSIQEAARLLIECKIGVLPVLRNGVLAGIISAEDILRYLLAQQGRLTSAPPTTL